jgi:hypothetical protein
MADRPAEKVGEIELPDEMPQSANNQQVIAILLAVQSESQPD